MRLSIFIVAVLFVACNPVEKALKVARQNPNEFAGFCAEVFPVGEVVSVKDSVRFDTLYLQSDPVVEYQTINDTVYKTIKSPGQTFFITKTVSHDSLIIKRDTAKEVSLQKKADDAVTVSQKIQQENSGLKKFKKITIWALILLAAGTVIGFIIKRYV